METYLKNKCVNSDYDNYYGSVLDPLHGDIRLSEIEKWIISQPIFSRLRRVKQNTFLYYVFPSANHTRFEHSIGVMHLAGKIYDSCKENYITGIKKLERHELSPVSSFFDLSNLNEREPIYYQELRIAALLHDIGHGPMSHLFDEFAISKDSFLKIIGQDILFQNYIQGFEKLIENKGGKVEHEIMSCVFVIYLLNKLKNESLKDPHKFSQSVQKIIEEINVDRIIKMIEPDFSGLTEILDDKSRNYTSFFSRIVTAFPIDADRMDYLLRDSYFSGVTYGIYDINRVFASFIPVVIDNAVNISYKESGLDSMLRFIQSRSHLYSQVYFHKTNRAANQMLISATQNFRYSSGKLLNSTTLQNLIDFYIRNTDEYFLTNTIANDCVKDGGNEKRIMSDLIDRKLFKRIFEKKIVLERSESILLEKIKGIHSRIQNRISLYNESQQDVFATSDISINENFKDADKGKAILIAQKKNSDYTFLKNWKSINKEFQALDVTTITVRVYLMRSFNNPPQFENYKMDILRQIKAESDELGDVA